MFLTASVNVGTMSAKDKQLYVVIRDHILRGFTGYIAYVNSNVDMYVYIALINGKIVACRSMVKNIIQEGLKCIDIVSDIIESVEGEIEIYESCPLHVERDLLIYPLSRVIESQEVRNKLKIGIVVPPVGVKESTEREDIPDTCMDPFTLYEIIKLSKLVEVSHEELSFQEMSQKIRKIMEALKPRYIYISGHIEKALIRIIHDPISNTTYVELIEDNNIYCGTPVLERLLKNNVLISNIKVWIKPS